MSNQGRTIATLEKTENKPSISLLLQKGVEFDTGGEWDKALLCFEQALRSCRTDRDGHTASL